MQGRIQKFFELEFFLYRRENLGGFWDFSLRKT